MSTLPSAEPDEDPEPSPNVLISYEGWPLTDLILVRSNEP
jgi:hypothetical protein